ncbi:MAG: hypothetical protein LAN62_11655 [Acidobacteriia bacterium]|nr:hypothetical protein [Terriglobia bacterium]
MPNRVERSVALLGVVPGGRRKALAVIALTALLAGLLAARFAVAGQNQPASQRPAEKQGDQQAQPPSQPEASVPAPQEAEQKTSKTYTVRNGTLTYGRTEESDRKKTADGEVETQRVRMPSFSGDQRVLMEREIRTKALPDGTIEKEYVLKNPDGSNRLVPTEIIREKIRKSGDTTTISRETLKPDYEGHWTPTRKEQVTENGTKEKTESVKVVREPTASGDWRVTDREVTRAKAVPGGTESRSLRQTPDAYGRLSDYEVRQERTSTVAGQQTREVTVTRRDFQDTDHPKFFLVEHTVSREEKSADGTATTKSTTESDLLNGGVARGATPGPPRVVEQKVEVVTPGKDGASRQVTTVEERGADRQLRPSYEVIQETDRDGHVRQIFMPSR